ncbi:MAG: bacteriohemerythrin [Mariprofundaceae bacterium]
MTESQLLTWESNHSVSDPKLDAQHKKLLDIASELQDVLHQGKSDELLLSHFNTLITCTQAHFASEEDSMRRHHYPGLTCHKSAHDSLIQQALSLQRQIDEGEQVFSMDIICFIRHWIIHHVETADARYGAYLEDKTPPFCSES